MKTKIRIEKVANGYIVSEPIEQNYAYTLSDAYVFNTLYEVYQHLEKVIGVNADE